MAPELSPFVPDGVDPFDRLAGISATYDCVDPAVDLFRSSNCPLQTTVHKRLGFARQIFRMARKHKLIESNPFADVSSKAINQQDRQQFITTTEIDRILAVCNPTWRTIVVLCRYGGLRCPSEVLSLRWDGVNWETDRVVVHSPKTTRHGKSSRVIPLFPELKPFLAEAFDLAPKGAEYVIGGGYRESALTPSGWRNCNLRTQFERLVKRAGL